MTSITYAPHAFRTERAMAVLNEAKDAGDNLVIAACRRFLNETRTTSKMNDAARAAWSIIREF